MPRTISLLSSRARTIATASLVSASLFLAPLSAQAEPIEAPSVTAGDLVVSSTFDGDGFDVDARFTAAFAGECATGWVKPVLYVAVEGEAFDADATIVRSLGWRELTTTGAHRVSFRVIEPGDYGIAWLSPLVTGDCLEGPAELSVAEAPTSEFHLTRTPTANLATPSIAGIAQVGRTLTANQGSWQGPALAFSYQWLRSGVAIDGADQQSYLATPDDLGKALTIQVTATSKHDQASATSAATAAVLSGAIEPFVPVIVGTRAVGFPLSVDLPAGYSYGYQWYRGTAKITGATGPTYLLGTADGGQAIKVSVAISTPGYTTVTRTSAATTAILRKLSAPTPAISGAVKVGATVAVAPGTWGPAPVTLRYQWLLDGTPVVGATASTFKLGTAHLGHTIAVSVTGSKSAYATVTKTSATSAAVALGTITLAAPKIIGTVKVGSKLTASVGATVPASGLAFEYQWYANGVAIADATSSTFTPVTTQAGTKITLRVTASSPYYVTKSALSLATLAVAGPSAVTSKSGYLRVGVDIQPGTYYTGVTSGCYWARLTDATGSFDSIIANDFGSGRRMVTISAGDAFFEASRCGSWYRFDGTGKLASSVAGNGVYGVGADMVPGLYTSTNSSSCYAATLFGLGGTLDDIDTNEFWSEGGIRYWTVVPGTFFESSGCGTWTRVG